MYCTYLTTYSGNKLPMFYIGSTSVKNIENGYHGSVSSKKFKKIWYDEIKSNHLLFKTQILRRYSTRKEAIEIEKLLQQILNVVRSEMYINMAIATPNGFFGRDVCGENNPRYGKPASDECKRKIGAVHKGVKLSKEHKIKISENSKLWWIKNHDKYAGRYAGENNPMYGKYGDDHPAYGKKRSDESKAKTSKSLTGLKKSKEHRQKMNCVYKIETLHNETFIGYGINKFCKMLNIKYSTFLYTLKSKKFMNGFRIIENLGKCNNPNIEELSSIKTQIMIT